MGKPLKYTAEQFIAAIPGSAGIVTTIARKIGTDWYTAHRYINQHPTVKAAYNAECESVLDLTESKLIGMINNSEAWAVKYMLSTKGARRGYTETSHHIIEERLAGELDAAFDKLKGKLSAEEFARVIAILGDAEEGAE